MKTKSIQGLILTIIFCACAPYKYAAAQHLPSPAANLQTLPTGSYVIPMDNTYQFNGSSLFNLKAYGLVVHLLNNGIRVKWVIAAGKVKDGIDFSATTELRMPTANATPTLRDFRGGPFVIFKDDTTGVTALINSFNTTNALSGNSRPKLQRTLSPVVVDVRYDLTGFRPKAAILNDGGNEDIHEGYFVAASIPAASYAISYGRDLLTGCYTFASEPHNDRSGAIVDTAIMGIKSFVNNGGNFLAQCAAITNYENSSHGRFQTTTGVTSSYVNVGSTLAYANADLSYSQFQGGFEGGNGVVDAWTINASGTNNHHPHATGTGVNTSVLIASVSKVGSFYSGGMVFYLGTHDFATNRADEINGIRMYMNAFLTPSIPSCALNVLPSRLADFSGSSKQNAATLKWEVSFNEEIHHFELLKSTDGSEFNSLGSIAASNSSSDEAYTYIDANFRNSSAYYRLKIVSNTGTFQYSKTIEINEPGNEDKLAILQNPVSQELSFTYFSTDHENSVISVYNAGGFKVHPDIQHTAKGIKNYSIALGSSAGKGIYYVVVMKGGRKQILKFMKV
jgi:hypothetical protein